MPVKVKLKKSLQTLKKELQEKQERLLNEWDQTKRDLKARQKLFGRELKAKQDEFLLEWDDVQERSKERFDQWLDRFDIDELQGMLDRYKEDISALVQPPIRAEVEPFVTPEGTLTMRLIAETPGRIDDYERMIRDAVEVFGGVWNFMYVNSVTSNHLYWREPSHSIGQVNEWVLDRIFGTGNPPADFGVYVTKDNIDEHLKEVRAQLMALPSQEDSWTRLMKE